MQNDFAWLKASSDIFFSYAFGDNVWIYLHKEIVKRNVPSFILILCHPWEFLIVGKERASRLFRFFFQGIFWHEYELLITLVELILWTCFINDICSQVKTIDSVCFFFDNDRSSIFSVIYSVKINLKLTHKVSQKIM